MIRNIVFDMGNVLIYFRPEAFMDRCSLSSEDREQIRSVIFRSSEWLEMDQGLRDERQMLEYAKSMLPEHLHSVAEQMIFHWDEPLLPIPGMEELVCEMHRNGYSLFLLSNASKRQHSYWGRIPGSELFSGTLISADHLLLKPQPEIFRLLYATFSLKPEECLFIDDYPPNIAAARESGMEAIRFLDDVSQLRAALRAAGVNVSE